MSKYVPMDLVKSLSGKVCQHSDTYFAIRNGTQYNKIHNTKGTWYKRHTMHWQTTNGTSILRISRGTRRAI